MNSEPNPGFWKVFTLTNNIHAEPKKKKMTASFTNYTQRAERSYGIP